MPINKRRLINQINKEYLSDRVKHSRSFQEWVDGLNSIMKKHKVYISENVARKFLKENLEKRNYTSYMAQLEYLIENRATINSIKKIYGLFIDKEHVTSVKNTLRDIHEYKNMALNNVNTFYDPKYSSSKYYKEYIGLFKNLKQIEEEMFIREDSKRQLNFFNMLSRDRDIKENYFARQRIFLGLYEDIIKLIYYPAIKGTVVKDQNKYRSLKYIKFHGMTYEYNIQNLYQLKTRAILEDIVYRIKGYENKINTLYVVKQIVIEKRNITVEELSKLGDILSSFSSSNYDDVLKHTTELFNSYKSKLDKYRNEKAYSKSQKEKKAKRSLFNLFTNIHEFVSKGQKTSERYKRYEAFVDKYIKLEKIYDPEAIVKRLEK
jgi:hypothetical protein